MHRLLPPVFERSIGSALAWKISLFVGVVIARNISRDFSFVRFDIRPSNEIK